MKIEGSRENYCEIRKVFPDIRDEMANDPGKLKKIIEVKKLLEEELEKVKIK